MKKEISKVLVVLSFGFITIILFPGCKKFLDQKPDDKLGVLNRPADLQALLDNYAIMNYNDPSAAEICSDNYFLKESVYEGLTPYARSLHIWDESYNFAPRYNSWRDTYEIVYLANLILENSKKIRGNDSDSNALNYIDGQALFHRGRSFLNLISVWSLAYSETESVKDLGVPLLRTTDYNAPSVRASVEESYQQVITDLKAATARLPVQGLTPFRPTKYAGYGMLARTYLLMGKYSEAKLYADSCLQGGATLMDFNLLNPSLIFPILQLTSEVIFESRMPAGSGIGHSQALINPELYNLYESGDLRKIIFFKQNLNDYQFRGYYAGGPNTFNGLAVDELLLIRAECLIRNGNISAGMTDLNLLRKNRMKSSAFIPLQAQNADVALALVKKERRMELPLRGLRWMDIKRWNQEGDGIILKRNIGGKEYTLQPNSLKYAISIPEDIIALSGIQQNPR